MLACMELIDSLIPRGVLISRPRGADRAHSYMVTQIRCYVRTATMRIYRCGDAGLAGTVARAWESHNYLLATGVLRDMPLLARFMKGSPA